MHDTGEIEATRRTGVVVRSASKAVTTAAEGWAFYGDEEVNEAQLIAGLCTASHEPKATLNVTADAHAQNGAVVRVMDLARTKGSHCSRSNVQQSCAQLPDTTRWLAIFACAFSSTFTAHVHCSPSSPDRMRNV